MKWRYIPPDTKEDIKLGKILPLSALLPLSATVLIGGFCAIVVFPNWIMKIVVMLIPPLVVIGSYAIDLPNFVRKVTHWHSTKRKVSNLSHLAAFKEIGSECVYRKSTAIKRTEDMTDEDWELEKAKASRKIFFEYSDIPPWEIDPEEYKERRADEFANDILAAMQEGVSVSIYGACKPEQTTILDKRMDNLKKLSASLRQIEKERIDFHYQFSKTAEHVSYVVALSGKNDLENIPSFMSIGDGMQMLGQDMVEDLINTQITPTAKISRGYDIIKLIKEMADEDARLNKFEVFKLVIKGIPSRIVEMFERLKPKPKLERPEILKEIERPEIRIRESQSVRAGRRRI